MATWRLSKSLERLRQQVNAAAPGRSKASDGTKGDDAHAARKSDHNPDAKGVVRALDITHDPKNGVDSEKLAEALRLSRDPRISYIISNRKIASSQAVHGEAAWAWRLYSGANAHNKHCHISVVANDALADSVQPWAIDPAFAAAAGGEKPAVTPITAKPIPATDRRSRMGKVMLDFEARRDKAGHLAVYKLPANDGGGTYEVAGINDRYHPVQAAHLRDLIGAGKFDDAEASAIEYMVKYTDVAAGWTTNAGVEFFLRDCVLNRGPTGATKILQMALGVEVKGGVGPVTRDAMAAAEPGPLLDKLRAARERYEDEVAGARPNLRAGLVNRWNKALAEAKRFASETPTSGQKKTEQGVAAAGGAVVTGTVTAGVQQGWGLWQWGLLAAGVAVLGLAIYFGLRWWRQLRAAPPSYHDEAIAKATTTADALPAPGDLWRTPEVQATKPSARKPRATAKKPAAKKVAKKSTKKRKAA